MIKKIKRLRNLEKEEKRLRELQEELETREKELAGREEYVNDRFNKIAKIDEGDSSVTFSFGTELEGGVGVETRINEDIVTALIDQGVLSPESAEDERAIQLAFILLADEVAEQILMEAAGYAD